MVSEIALFVLTYTLYTRSKYLLFFMSIEYLRRAKFAELVSISAFNDKFIHKAFISSACCICTIGSTDDVECIFFSCSERYIVANNCSLPFLLDGSTTALGLSEDSSCHCLSTCCSITISEF